MNKTKSISVTQKKVVITLSGTSGTASITGIGGLTKTATFATSLTITGTNFVTANATAYAAVGITLTAALGVLTFTNATSDSGFGSAMITNATGNLSGAVVVTSNKVYLGGYKRVALLFRNASLTGSAALVINTSLDEIGTTIPATTASNIWIDNVTNAITEDLTRVNGKTPTSAGDTLLWLSREAIVNWIELVVTKVTDGTHTSYVLVEE